VKRWLSVVAVVMLLQGSASASPQAHVDFGAAATAASREPVPSVGASAPVVQPAPPSLDPRYAEARLEYDTFALRHAQRTFVWQYWSGIVVFLLVMATVVMGLYLSFLHFREGRRGGGGQIKMSTTGIEVSSPVIGLLILVISLGFFYLYLSQVYPITEVKP
jgi:hypothetical protein